MLSASSNSFLAFFTSSSSGAFSGSVAILGCISEPHTLHGIPSVRPIASLPAI